MSSSSVEDWPLWICDICQKEALDSHTLDVQRIIKETVIVFDKNGVKWVQCEHCSNRLHLSCAKNIPKNAEESDFDIYLCYDCGWSMVGAEHSE